MLTPDKVADIVAKPNEHTSLEVELADLAMSVNISAMTAARDIARMTRGMQQAQQQVSQCVEAIVKHTEMLRKIRETVTDMDVVAMIDAHFGEVTKQ